MNVPKPYQVIRDFEEKVAKYCNAPFAVAVDSCASALQLCFEYQKFINNDITKTVEIPNHTYVSVPQSIIHAGFKIKFVDKRWTGSYQLLPYNIWDSARSFHKNLFDNTLRKTTWESFNKNGSQLDVCLSFHYRKILPLGKGGMILTNDEHALNWYRAARFSGRHEGEPELTDDITIMGHNMVMTPDIASRGLTMMQFMKDYNNDLIQEDRDLSKIKLFDKYIGE